jgi:LPS sulfotransferase NodH
VDIFISKLIDEKFKFIHLKRNAAERAVSAYIAHRTGVWHLDAESDVDYLDRDVPHYDFRKISLIFKKQMEWTRNIERLCSEVIPKELCLEIHYDEICASQSDQIKSVCRFLEVTNPDFTNLDTTCVKLSGLTGVNKEFLERFRKDLGHMDSQASANQTQA